VPCRIAFERGKERHFWFLAISVGTSGWLVLAEELPMKKPYGVVRVAAPLAGCNVCIVVCYPYFLILIQVVLLAESCTNLCWFSPRKNP
jgi:protein CLEC16A